MQLPSSDEGLSVTSAERPWCDDPDVAPVTEPPESRAQPEATWDAIEREDADLAVRLVFALGLVSEWHPLEVLLRQMPSGLTLRQVTVLRCLAAGPISNNDLARRLSVTPGRATVFASHLVARGFVTQRVHETDRRARHLHLAPAGMRALQEADQLITFLIAGAVARLSIEDTGQATVSLDVIERVLFR